MTIIDLNIYSHFSLNSSLKPIDILKKANSLKLDFVCINDKNIYEENTEIEYLNTLNYKTKIIRGVELTTNKGSVIVFGLINNFWQKIKNNNSNILDFEKVKNEVDKINGVLIHTAPSLNINDLNKKQEDVVFILNSKNTKKEVKNHISENNFKKVAGSSASKLNEIGKYLTLFKNKIKTKEEFIKSLKEGTYIPISLEDYKTKNLKSFFTS